MMINKIESVTDYFENFSITGNLLLGLVQMIIINLWVEVLMNRKIIYGKHRPNKLFYVFK